MRLPGRDCDHCPTALSFPSRCRLPPPRPYTMSPSILSSSVSTQKDMDALPIVNYRLIDFDSGLYRRQVCEPCGNPRFAHRQSR